MNSSFILVVEFPTVFFKKNVLVKILDGRERKSSLELVSKELNHLAAISHVYAGV